MAATLSLALALASFVSALGSPCVAQTAPPDGQPTPDSARRELEEGWDLHNGIAFAVDDRIVTLDEYFDRQDELRPRAATTTPEQVRALRRYVANEFITKLLGERAGESLELSGVDLDARLRDWMREQREPLGSIGYGDSLRREGRDPLAELPRARSEFLGSLWMGRQVGSPGGAGRPMVDTFVRPGMLRAEYPAYVEAMQSELVQLRAVDLAGNPVGGLDNARDILLDMRQQIIDGEKDMGTLAAENSTNEDRKQAKGLIAPTSIRQLPAGEVRDFVMNNEIGAISQPIRWSYNGPAGALDPVVGYGLLRIEGKTRADSAPPFASSETQNLIRTKVADALSKERRAAAADRLGRNAMVWTHPVVRRYLGE